MIIGVCQVGWIVYKADIISKVVEWFMKIPRVLARKTEKAAGATMGALEAVMLGTRWQMNVWR
jgi:hypothetical protein